MSGRQLLEVLVIGNTDSDKHLSLPQRLVKGTFERLNGGLQMPVHITQTSKDRAGDFLPANGVSYAAVIIDPARQGEADREWHHKAHKRGLLNGQTTYFLSSKKACPREKCYAASIPSITMLAYRIAGKK